MPKAYWIARVDVKDPERYKLYIEGTKAPFTEYGARPLVRAGNVTMIEGGGRGRNVVLEFDDMETALACYNSPGYQEALKHRQAASEGEIIIVEGIE